ncbi:DUF2007 domain-containing protein [Marinobacter salinisoli]|uniref:DUF2007 domain-containing protein n=1 Tax=Marinobacter salinisoli TaxID=2769486 RepID=A0ABX7MVI1_9GAMM|nr:DUF2007 domain-containing protein [Marinobacter salinisoli]QSP96385.1 DUF2007 domain-containing protein [Marinobacter salinisoli]
MQIAYRARDITEAHIVAGFLGAHGVEAFVGGHYLQGAMGEIGAAGFSNVHVNDEDLFRARELVREYETGAPQALVSASDGEGRADFYARWFLFALVVLAIAAIHAGG